MNKKIFAIAAAVMVVTLCALLLIQLVPFFADNSPSGGSSGSSSGSSSSGTGTNTGTGESGETIEDTTIGDQTSYDKYGPSDLVYDETEGVYILNNGDWLDTTNYFNPYCRNEEDSLIFMVDGKVVEGDFVVASDMIAFQYPHLFTSVKLGELSPSITEIGYAFAFFWSVPDNPGVYYLVDSSSPFELVFDGATVDGEIWYTNDDTWSDEDVYILASEANSDHGIPPIFFIHCFAIL